ncbi:MAG: hypothetical protein ACLTR5_08810 [Oscillospiraceae bacterium]
MHEHCSSAAASRTSVSGCTAPHGQTSVSAGAPFVSVPVLSKTTQSAL